MVQGVKCDKKKERERWERKRWKSHETFL